MGRMHVHVLSLAAAAALALPGRGAAEEAAPAEREPPKLSWEKGPRKVAVGSMGELDLPATDAFLEAGDARKLLEHEGNIVDDSVKGLVVSTVEGQDWFIVFEFNDVGYVKDTDGDKIDADGLLSRLKEGTEASNAERKKRGASPMHVLGWVEAPHYDARTHHLTWATRYRTDAGHEGVNYNVRLLGRAGVMEVTLVESVDRLQASKPAVDEVLAAYRFKPGKTYAEWVPGDKVAEYGLAGLVAAGAGAAAVKLGFFGALAKLLAKMGKLVVVVIAGLGAAIARAWRGFVGLFRRKEVDRTAGDLRAPPGPGQST
jgi:uncharacterized membrane-anchored protein